MTGTLGVHGRVVTCCPEDGRLTLKVGRLLLKSDSPWQSPDTNGLIITIWYNEVVRLWRGVQENSCFLCIPLLLQSAWPG